MNPTDPLDPYGVLTEPATMTLRRRLPGPVDRVWAFLTDGELRGQWLAAGPMVLEVGAPFEFVWRNDSLSEPPSQRPEGFAEEQRMQSRITELDPPHRLTFTWGGTGDVTFALAPIGDDEVLLTVTHRRVASRTALTQVAAGWHMHLDVLVARAAGRPAPPFWDGWARLRADYDARVPA